MSALDLLAGNLWRAAALAAGAALLALSAYIWGVPIIGGGLKAEIADRDKTIALRNAALERAARDLRICAGNLDMAAGAIGRQNEAVRQLQREGEESARRATNALSEAQRANLRADEAVARIRGRKATGCETGREIMEAPL